MKTMQEVHELRLVSNMYTNQATHISVHCLSWIGNRESQQVTEDQSPPLTMGQRIALLRRMQGWTQMQLAIHMETDKTFVSRLETDSVKTIRSDVLMKLARLFKVSTDYILGMTDALPLEYPEAKALFETEMEELRRRREARRNEAKND